MSYRRTDNTDRILSERSNKVALAIRFALDGIHRASTDATPKLSGQLRADINKRVVGKRGTIRWGKKYAYWQERGYTSGPVRRYTTPGTGKDFAKNAARKEGNNPRKYLNMVGL